MSSPDEDIALPAGFRFVWTPNTLDLPADALRITVHDHSGPSAVAEAQSRRRKNGSVRTISVPCAEPEHGEVTLVIGARGADIFVSKAAWDDVAQPVLLLVAQYARYFAMEQHFVALQDQACRDHRHAVSAGFRSLRQRRRLVRTSCEVRDLVSDWAYFSGPLADPRRFCASEEALETYSALADELDIGAWAKGIDDVLVDVEQTYETLSDKLFHYRLFIWGMALEIVIIGMIAGLLAH